jgi:TonB family protein
MRRLLVALAWLSLPVSASAMIAVEPIREVIHAHQAEVVTCWERALTRNPHDGRIVVTFELAGDGHVVSVGVTTDEIGDPELATCVTDAIRTWQFPSYQRAGTIRINYPFSFTRPT